MDEMEIFFTKWSYKIQFYQLSGEIFYLNVKVSHTLQFTVLFQVSEAFLPLYKLVWGFLSLRNGVSVYEMESKYLISSHLVYYFTIIS